MSHYYGRYLRNKPILDCLLALWRAVDWGLDTFANAIMLAVKAAAQALILFAVLLAMGAVVLSVAAPNVDITNRNAFPGSQTTWAHK